MNSRDQIESLIRTTYAARVRGDISGVLAGFADDAVFSLNGRGTGIPGMGETCVGCQAVGATIGPMIEAFRFDNWKELSLMVDGDSALLHWSADVTCVPTGKTEHFDVFDMFKLRNGKITYLRQATDTAMIATIAS